jgi:hypothetical protein
MFLYVKWFHWIWSEFTDLNEWDLTRIIDFNCLVNRTNELHPSFVLVRVSIFYKPNHESLKINGYGLKNKFHTRNRLINEKKVSCPSTIHPWWCICGCWLRSWVHNFWCVMDSVQTGKWGGVQAAERRWISRHSPDMVIIAQYAASCRLRQARWWANCRDLLKFLGSTENWFNSF